MYFKERTLFDLNILQNIIKIKNNDIKKINVYEWSNILDINTCGTKSSIGNKLCCHYDRKNNKRPKQKKNINSKLKIYKFNNKVITILLYISI